MKNVTQSRLLNSLALLLTASLALTGCNSNPRPTVLAANTKTTERVFNIAESDKSTYESALSAIEKDQSEAAVTTLKKLALANPGYFDVWINLAVANYKLKRMDEAKVAITYASALDPQSAEVKIVQGLISAKEGRYKDAEQFYLNALTINPLSTDAHYNLALLYDVFYQDIAKAIPHYERYLALSSQKDEPTEAWKDELKQKLLRRGGQ